MIVIVNINDDNNTEARSVQVLIDPEPVTPATLTGSHPPVTANVCAYHTWGSFIFFTFSNMNKKYSFPRPLPPAVCTKLKYKNEGLCHWVSESKAGALNPGSMDLFGSMDGFQKAVSSRQELTLLSAEKGVFLVLFYSLSDMYMIQLNFNE